MYPDDDEPRKDADDDLELWAQQKFASETKSMKAKKPCLFICDQSEDCELSGIPCNMDMVARGWCIATHRYVVLNPYIDKDHECVQINPTSWIRVPKDILDKEQ